MSLINYYGVRQMTLKINNLILILSLSVLLLVFSSVKVFADENVNASEEAEADIEEILVTANRTEQSISDVSQAVQALSGDDLQDLQITDFEQMIDLIPGAVQNSSISQGSNVYSIRGVASAETDGDATIGYYLDNFAFSLPGRPYAPVTDIYDTERVEVLRGPSGTLYGLGSLGGTIKVITKDPVIGEFEGSFKATLADIDDGDSSQVRSSTTSTISSITASGEQPSQHFMQTSQLL